MPSPFPGMNPYIEKPNLWRDFHGGFLFAFRAALVPQVRPRYFVELEESVYIDPSGDAPRLFAVADAAVARPRAKPARLRGGVATVVPAPVTARVPGAAPTRRARRLVVRDSASQEVVTVIELLSPSNKAAGVDRDKYLEKRAEVLASAAHFVELDLLRGGKRMPVDPLPECAYYALVSRAWERPDVGVWPVGLRDPLPAVPVPLRPGEPEPLVDLKPVLDRTYDEAGYEDRVYRDPPDPPLPPGDAAWAVGFVPKV